jgi:hypothetical protein
MFVGGKIKLREILIFRADTRWPFMMAEITQIRYKINLKRPFLHSPS